MEVQSHAVRWSILCVVALVIGISWACKCCAQTSGTSGQPATGNASGAGDANQGGADAGSLDKLLDMAEKDVGQLSNVDVSGHTGSPALDQPVSTVERQQSTVGKTPAAVFVITNEMIRRSGAQTIPDLLRMVPGVQVAQISSDEWAVSARGFNQQYSNLLLVQIDGRTVYDLFFGGVIWGIQDLVLEDVERIEVIRGPGATIWGANAVNGVINIITKKAQDTQGVLLQGGAGDHERGFTNARTGGRIGEDLYYRFYGRWFDRGPSFLPDSGTAPDSWFEGRGGFRMDYDAGQNDIMTLQGDYFDGKNVTLMPNQIPTPPFSVQSNNIHVTGENILYRWTHKLDEDSDWSLQTYYDHVEYHYLDPAYALARDMIDLDFQHRFPLGERHDVIWGFGYRMAKDASQNTSPFFIDVQPPARVDNYYCYFLQDQITLVEDRWFFIAGSKMEHNPYSNFEYQPTVRLLWTPTDRHSIWGAVSRAVHIPTRETADSTVRLPPVGFTPPPFSMPIFPVVMGNPNLLSEELLAYETGVRVQATEHFSWDLALFYNQYDNLFSFSHGLPQFEPPFYLDVPQFYENGMSGETYGVELASNYIVNERWRLQLAYSYIRLFLRNEPGQTNFTNPGETPVNQVYLQSSWDLGYHWRLDLMGRYVDAVFPSTPTGGTITIPNYIVGDARLAWCGRRNLEVSVAARNLFNGHYSEFLPLTGAIPYQVGPEVYGQVTWRY